MAFTHKISKALSSLFNKHRPTLSSPAPLFLTPKLQEPPFAVPAVAPIPVKIISPKLDLQEHERLYATMKTGKLLIPMVTLSSMAVGSAVNLGKAVMRSKAVEENWEAKKVVVGVGRPRVYRQFCAGEDADEAAQTLRRLWKGRMHGIIDYSLEDEAIGAACDRNFAGISSTVELTATLPPSLFFVGENAEEAAKTLRWLGNGQMRGILDYGGAARDRNFAGFPSIFEMTATPSPSSANFTCVKITAISAFNQVGKKDPSLHLPMKKPFLQVLIDAADLPLLVNAEYILIQPAIDRLTYATAPEFNKDERPTVHRSDGRIAVLAGVHDAGGDVREE